MNNIQSPRSQTHTHTHLHQMSSKAFWRWVQSHTNHSCTRLCSVYLKSTSFENPKITCLTISGHRGNSLMRTFSNPRQKLPLQHPASSHLTVMTLFSQRTFPLINVLICLCRCKIVLWSCGAFASARHIKGVFDTAVCLN